VCQWPKRKTSPGRKRVATRQDVVNFWQHGKRDEQTPSIQTKLSPIVIDGGRIKIRNGQYHWL
jgi:hypothetical protein